MKLDKRIENRPFYVPAYTPYSMSKPKLHEYGYFTDDLRVCNKLEECDNLNYLDCEQYYEYGELIDYDGSNPECPYRGAFEDATWDETCYYEENYAFYIPESSIPKEKQKWYRKHRYNTPTYKGYWGTMEEAEKAFFSDVEDLPVEEYSYVYGAE